MLALLALLALTSWNLYFSWHAHQHVFEVRNVAAVEMDSCTAGSAAASVPNSSAISWGRAPYLPRYNPRITIPSGGQTSDQRFSHWQCTGDLEDAAHLRDRTCAFSNVCYDKAIRDFVFFGKEDMPPVIYDHRKGSQFQFRRRVVDGSGGRDLDFVHLNYNNNWRDVRTWQPGMVDDGSAPLTWSPRLHMGAIPDTHKALTGVYAFSAPHRDTTNLGHFLWEDIFPLFASMLQLGKYTPCLNILRTRGCESSYVPRLCSIFERGFLLPLTGSCGAQLALFDNFVQTFNESLLCFETLLVGATYEAFDVESEARNINRGPFIRLFREVVLSWHGVDPLEQPKTHQILLAKKDGRRSISNFHTIYNHVVDQFANRARVCYTTYVSMTITEQLRMLSQTTVAVSPCGGISLILPFLPEGAYVILMSYSPDTLFGLVKKRFLGWPYLTTADTHGACPGCSWTMDGEFWRHVSHVNKMYYQVFSPSDFEDGIPGRHSAIKVDPSRLNALIAAAIDDMQS